MFCFLFVYYIEKQVLWKPRTSNVCWNLFMNRNRSQRLYSILSLLRFFISNATSCQLFSLLFILENVSFFDLYCIYCITGFAFKSNSFLTVKTSKCSMCVFIESFRLEWTWFYYDRLIDDEQSEKKVQFVGKNQINQPIYNKMVESPSTSWLNKLNEPDRWKNSRSKSNET